MASGHSNDQPCRLLACPREIRDQIYAEVLLDFPTPSLRELRNCAMLGERGPLSHRSGDRRARERLTRTHKIETNILLTNRQIFYEGKQIMLCRGRLVEVIFSNVELYLRLSSCDLCLIDAKYSSLCMMRYQLHRNRQDIGDTPQSSAFVLCSRDIGTFCHAIMGDTTFEIHDALSSTTRHTLAFTTNFHDGKKTPEFLSRHTVHRQSLKPFRSALRGLQNISLQGSSVGLSRVLAATALRVFKSQPVLDPVWLLCELQDMSCMYARLCEIDKKDLYGTIAPLEKAMARWMRTSCEWNLWKLMQTQYHDPEELASRCMSSMYNILLLRFLQSKAYGPWQCGKYLPDGIEAAHTSLIAAAFQMYEMSLAMPESLCSPSWSPHPTQELCMDSHLAAAFVPLRKAQAGMVYTMGLALGYKAAKRAAELAPDESLSQERMEWYEGWKSEGIERRAFYEIDDEVMKNRGLMRWLGQLPGGLVLHAPV